MYGKVMHLTSSESLLRGMKNPLWPQWHVFITIWNTLLHLNIIFSTHNLNITHAHAGLYYSGYVITIDIALKTLKGLKKIITVIQDDTWMELLMRVLVCGIHAFVRERGCVCLYRFAWTNYCYFFENLEKVEPKIWFYKYTILLVWYKNTTRLCVHAYKLYMCRKYHDIRRLGAPPWLYKLLHSRSAETSLTNGWLWKQLCISSVIAGVFSSVIIHPALNRWPSNHCRHLHLLDTTNVSEASTEAAGVSPTSQDRESRRVSVLLCWIKQNSRYKDQWQMSPCKIWALKNEIRKHLHKHVAS